MPDTTPFDPEIARVALANRKADLLELNEISSASRSAVELDQTSVGRVSRIDAIQSQQMALAAKRQREVELAQIEAALTRIDDGDYGLCITCDEPISSRRLQHNPAAPSCIDCAR